MNYLADPHILLWAIRDDPNADDPVCIKRVLLPQA